jgi:hypothetical protein
MARYIIETRQYNQGVWLAPFKLYSSGDYSNTATSKAKAIELATRCNKMHFTPKRVIDTKTGAVIFTIGDDLYFAEQSALVTLMSNIEQGLTQAIEHLNTTPVKVCVSTLKKGDVVHAHGGLFVMTEDMGCSVGHVENYGTREGYGPTDCACGEAVCIQGEVRGYFKPGSPWTFQGKKGGAVDLCTYYVQRKP